ncbi:MULTISPECIES: nuclear transport factor 2 family protein [Flavobacteriaceae]|uniref:nuclear transport factor 2 family protein n=1 Tax=Flavobacteriaceae TaxID=49546 RepID=UPI00149182B6|nr:MULTISPECIES: nuclear transport factor 2 family protein [Allomuricauda]MDC6365565.1 nuclear transport factor 2 family protein [Muricauda sp. AC10]
MRLLKTLLIFFIVSNLFNCSNRGATNEETKIAKEELLQTIDKFNKAFQEGNLDIIESLITDNYIHTNGNSKSIRKKDWLSYLNKREKEIKSGNLEVVEYKMEEVEIEFHESIAIVTGKVFVSNKVKGEIKNNEYRITNLWVKVNGNWQRAGFHDGKIE